MSPVAQAVARRAVRALGGIGSRGLACGALMVVAAWAGAATLQGPEPVPADAPAGVFSAARALPHVRVLAAEPRAPGTPAHAAARRYLVGELKRLGWEVDVQARTVFAAAPSPRLAAVANVVARKPGTLLRPAILLVAHYDSLSYGANDNAVGVATLLETARALSADGPLVHPVLLLFSDAEEFGLLGAKAFVESHAWAADVGFVMNFDARGRAGPSVMFETGPRSAGIVERLATTVSHPVAASFMTAVYKRMPNSTDFTVFRDAVPGLNFAYIRDPAVYHSVRDTTAAVELGALQHHGSYALALARSPLASSTVADGEDLVFFPLVRGVFVRYRERRSVPLAAAILLLFGVTAWRATRARGLSGAGVLRAVVMVLASLFACGAASVGVWLAMRAVHADRGSPIPVPAFDEALVVIGCVGLTCAALVRVYALAGKRVADSELYVGCLFVWMAVMCATAVALPGASYLFTWPLAAALVGLGSIVWPWRASVQPPSLLPLLPAAAAAVLLLFPVGILLYFALGAPSAALTAIFSVMTLGLVLPIVPGFRMGSVGLLEGGAALAGIVALVWANVTAGYTSSRPRQNSLVYAVDHDVGQSTWYSFDRVPDAWTARFLTVEPRAGNLHELLPSLQVPLLAQRARAPQLCEPPSLTVLSDSARQGGVVPATMGVRLLSVRVVPARRDGFVWVTLTPQAYVKRLTVDGVAVGDGRMHNPAGGPSSQFVYFAPPDAGFTMDLEVQSPGAVKGTESDRIVIGIVEQSPGFPSEVARTVPLRPPDVIPSSMLPSDVTLSRKSFSFD